MGNNITIEPVDDAYIKVRCPKDIAKELNSFFTFTVPNHKYNPSFRKKIWDGKIRLYSLLTQKIYKGMLPYVEKFFIDRNYHYKNNITVDNFYIEDEAVKKFMLDFLKVSSNGKQITPHDYQIQAVTHGIKNKRALLLSPTGSGKSLIIYTLMRFFADYIPADKSILIVVPTTSLVAQLYNDFEDYSRLNGWSVKNNIQKIYAGENKEITKKVVISTWQSIFRENDKFFDNFYTVIGDECHLFKAKSLSTIMEKLKNCPIRFGLSGTLDNTKVHKFIIEGLFGPLYRVTSTKTLIEDDILSKIDINCLILKYPDKECNKTKRMEYRDELDYIFSSEKRYTIIKQLCKSLKGNTLVLFSHVDTHGKKLYEMMKDFDKHVFFIAGEVPLDQREFIRQKIDTLQDSILIASYGTCSTGINIKNIHNIVFSSPSKSVVRVLQSIGRGLRKSDTKTHMSLYDIVDDLRYKAYKNHTFNHFIERLKIYENEKFPFKLIHLNQD
jgi:superfamily II DNA or RNA helicase